MKVKRVTLSRDIACVVLTKTLNTFQIIIPRIALLKIRIDYIYF